MLRKYRGRFICYTMQPPADLSSSFWPQHSTKLPNSGVERASKSSIYSLISTAAIWTIIFLVPAALICLPGPSTINEQFTFTGSLHTVQSCITVPAVYIFTILSYGPQLRLTWLSKRQMTESVLSIATLALHVVAFVWLAVTRFVRLRALPNHDVARFPDFPACDSGDCYFHFGWYWFSPVMETMGQGVLLGICLYGRYMEISGETPMGDGDSGEGEGESLLRQ
jgi:hypothetical protein